MDNPFYFSLARISAAQILRAAGIDRTKPSTLDILTDILTRYLHLLATTTMTYAHQAHRPESSIRDVWLAMEEIGIIAKGRLVSRKRIRRFIQEDEDEGWEPNPEDTDPDGEDEDDESTETLARLLNWFKGAQAAECRRVAGAGAVGGITVNGVGGISGEQSQRPSFITEYVTSMWLWRTVC
jgi:histone H3/H4